MQLEQRTASLLAEVSRLETAAEAERLLKVDFDKEISQLQDKIREQDD